MVRLGFWLWQSLTVVRKEVYGAVYEGFSYSSWANALTYRLFVYSYRNENFMSSVRCDDVLCALAVNVPSSAVSSASAGKNTHTHTGSQRLAYGNRDVANTRKGFKCSYI